MKAREASGKRYFTTKRKEVLLGSSQFRLGGARWSVIESFFIVIYETWLKWMLQGKYQATGIRICNE